MRMLEYGVTGDLVDESLVGKGLPVAHPPAPLLTGHR
jgi:hypothetical protein